MQTDEHPFRSAGEIVEDLVAEFVARTQPCPALPAFERMAANANYHRRRNRPQHPQDLAFLLKAEHIPENFLRRDINVNGRGTTPSFRHRPATGSAREGEDVVCRCDVSRRPTAILSIVHREAFVRHDDCTKQLPFAMCVMSPRRKTDYVAIFWELSAMLPNRFREIYVESSSRDIPNRGVEGVRLPSFRKK